jgi:alkylhydroperoxidase family enzyme
MGEFAGDDAQAGPIARVPVEVPPFDPAAVAALEAIKQAGGRILNLHRVSRLSPAIARKQGEYIFSLRLESALPRALNELAILRTAHRLGGGYVWAQHVPMARAAGLDPAAIEGVRDWRGSALFDRRQRAVLAYVDQAVPAGEVDDATFAALSAELPPREVVELTTIVAAYVGTVLVTKSLRIRLETEAELRG